MFFNIQKHLIDLNILNAIIYSNQGFLYKQYSYKKKEDNNKKHSDIKGFKPRNAHITNLN